LRFELEQRVAALPDAVAATFADPAFYETLDGLPKLGRPEVLRHEVDGEVVRLQIRYRFIGDLSAAVRAVIDPKKLTWVEHATHDLAARRVTFRMDADHYADRFRCSGSYEFDATSDGLGTVRRCIGELSVSVALVGSRVERAIVSGLQEHFDAEAPVIERWVAEHGG
jgi:hypothetical protein